MLDTHSPTGGAEREFDDGRERDRLADLEQQRDALYQEIKAALKAREQHDEDVQYELARWVELLETPSHALKKPECGHEEILARTLRVATLALPGLLSDKPKITCARRLRYNAKMEILRHNGLWRRRLVALTGGGSVETVSLGVLSAAFIGTVLHLLWPEMRDSSYVANLVPLGINRGTPTIAAAAFLGGTVSILSRLQAFAQLRDIDPMLMFLNAFFKPFIGVVFGLFALALLQSNLLPLDSTWVSEAPWDFQLWVVGFLAGFSERFSEGLISRGERMLGRVTKT